MPMALSDSGEQSTAAVIPGSKIPDSAVLTVEQVAAIVQMNEKTVLSWIRGELSGTAKLPAMKIGRQWRVLKRDLFETLATGSGSAGRAD